MAVNLTPQYQKAQDEYRRAQSPEDELHWLQEMYKELPKHKASEKVQSDLKQKIAKAKKDLEASKGVKKGPPGVKIPRQGAGTAFVLGGPNAGKSQLVRALTRATPEVAPYPFTTHTVTPGMMAFEDVQVQLVDTPPITADFMEQYLVNLVRGADLVVLMIDLATDDGLEQAQDVLARFADGKTRLARTTGLDEEDIGVSYTQTLLVPNKLDLPEAADRWALYQELYPPKFDCYPISAEQGQGLEELRAAIYRALDVIRVYAKKPTDKAADYAKPFTLRRGGTVAEFARLVHNDFADKLKFARIWGHGVHDGTPVKGDHEVHDKDVVELHVE